MRGKSQLKSGFTLIELLVSTSIILLLIGASTPSFNRLKNRNQVRTNAQQLQNCVHEARGLALAPETTDQNLISYYALWNNEIQPNTCTIYRNYYQDTEIIQEEVSSYKLTGDLESSLTNKKQIYEFETNKQGKVKDRVDLANQFFLIEKGSECLNLRFIKESGIILLEDSGIIDTNNNTCQ